MPSHRTKRFFYKRAQPNKASKLASLQDLLKAALKQREIVMDRARKLAGDDSTRLINYNGMHGQAGASGNLLGIEFLSFSAGQDPSALTIDPKAKELPMEEVALSASGRETVEGSVYCGILGNHIVLAQSPALKVLHFEQYINWLLIQTGQIGDDNYIGLVDFVNPKKASAFTSVQEVQLAGPVDFEPVISDDDSVDEIQSIQVKPSGDRWQAVKDFFGAAFDFPDSLSEKQIIAQKSLEVTLSLRWLRARDNDPSYLLNAVATNLRHLDDDVDFRIISKSGAEITKKDIKHHSKPQSIAWNKGRPKWDDIFPKMLKYLELLVKAGTIKT